MSSPWCGRPRRSPLPPLRRQFPLPVFPPGRDRPRPRRFPDGLSSRVFLFNRVFLCGPACPRPRPSRPLPECPALSSPGSPGPPCLNRAFPARPRSIRAISCVRRSSRDVISQTFISTWNTSSCNVCFRWEPWCWSGHWPSFRSSTPLPNGAEVGVVAGDALAEGEAVRRPAIEAGPRSQPRTADPPWSIHNRTRAGRESIAPAPLRGGLPVPGLGPAPPMRVRSGLVRERSAVSREQRVPATPPPRPTVPTWVGRNRPVRPGPATALASSPPIR